MKYFYPITSILISIAGLILVFANYGMGIMELGFGGAIDYRPHVSIIGLVAAVGGLIMLRLDSIILRMSKTEGK